MAIASVDSGSDLELHAAACAGDAEAFATLFGRHVDAVYDFAARLTGDREEAAVVVREAFTEAMHALGGLRDGRQFPTRVFASARRLALARMGGHGRPGEPVNGTAAAFDGSLPPAMEQDAEARAYTPLVREAAAELDPRQLSLLQLHLRHGLGAREIASVLGVSEQNGIVALRRLLDVADESIAAGVLAREDPKSCALLATALRENGSDTRPPGELAKAHLRECRTCQSRWRRIAPLAVFAAVPPIVAPRETRDEILGQLLAGWPGPARSSSGDRKAGVTLERPAGGDLSQSRTVSVALGLSAFAAGLTVLILLSPLNLARSGDDGGDSLPGLGLIPTQTPTPGAIASPRPGGGDASPGRGDDTPTPGPGDSDPTSTTSVPGSSATQTSAGTPSPTSTGTITATPTATATGTPTSTRTPTATPTPCIPQLDDNVNGVLNVGVQSSVSFIVFNFSPCEVAGVVVSSSQDWLSVSPEEFSIGPTGSSGNRTVSVTINRGGLPPGQQSGTVLVDPPSGPSVSVTVRVTGPTPTPTPTSTPTPSPTPSPPPDTEGPVLSLVACTVAGGEMTVVAHASDPSGVAEVEVSFAGGPAYDMGLATGLSADGNWSATFADDEGLDSGFLDARDSKGNPAARVAFTRAGSCQ